MHVDYPLISVIIPTYNGEPRLGACLDSIVAQDYPADRLEILVVDDASEDGTVALAESYGARVLENGHRNIERGKSIGLQNAAGELIFLIDDDNRLPEPGWLGKCVDAMLANPEAVGAEAIYFHHDRKDPAANRYCSLFGINDPTAYYLKRRDRLTATERRWRLPGKIVRDEAGYFLVEFDEDNLLTVGSQGFLTRKELLLKTNYAPYLFHMDSNLQLVKEGHNRYLMMKLDVIHIHSGSIGHFLGKLRRNMLLFLQQGNMRTYKWKTNPFKLLLVTLIMVSFVKPAYDSFKGYAKKPDPAWFLHPVLSFATVAIYGFTLTRWHLGRILKNRPVTP